MLNDDESLVGLIEHWRVSPYDFVVECLGVLPTEQQRGVMRRWPLRGRGYRYVRDTVRESRRFFRGSLSGGCVVFGM